MKQKPTPKQKPRTVTLRIPFRQFLPINPPPSANGTRPTSNKESE